jgi:DNA-binding beta-propeller fold protein YncE
LHGHSALLTKVAYSPDGKRLATASTDKTSKVWDAETGKELLTFRGHSNFVFDLVFSSDSKRIATASADNTVKIWDAENGQELLTLDCYAGDVAFGPDGKHLAAICSGTVKIWDTESSKELLSLASDSVRLAYTRDGRRHAGTPVFIVHKRLRKGRFGSSFGNAEIENLLALCASMKFSSLQLALRLFGHRTFGSTQAGKTPFRGGLTIWGASLSSSKLDVKPEYNSSNTTAVDLLQKLAGTLRQLGIWAVQAIQSERIWSEMQESGLETVVGVDAEAEDGCDFHRLVATQGGLELPTAES